MVSLAASEGGPAEVRVPYDRARCLGWSVYTWVLAIGCAAFAVLDPHAGLVYNLIPGWLFGGFGAGLFGAVAASWTARSRYGRPAVVIDNEGIELDRQLGGPLTPAIHGKVRWKEVARVLRNKRGAVLVELRDPREFWARQPWLSRVLGWSPKPGSGRMVPIGGRELAVDSQELVALARVRQESLRTPGDDRTQLPRNDAR